jgi:hypothetical protein
MKKTLKGSGKKIDFPTIKGWRCWRCSSWSTRVVGDTNEASEHMLLANKDMNVLDNYFRLLVLLDI